MVRRLAWSLACALVLSLGLSGVARADAASPTVTGVPGTPLVAGHATFDLGTVGYTQSEFFFEGTADAFGSATALTTDGKWTVAPSHQADYKSRIVVNRPTDPTKFNGTVLVEWFNVSGLVDASPDWQHTHVELIRRGYAYVGVSAQAVGVNWLKNTDPVRYASLNHPGDSFSYDIFSQAGQAIRDNQELLLGPGFTVERLIAAGESQSAGRLVTYLNAIQNVHEVYDGFFVHSRGAGGAALRQSPQTPAITVPSGTVIRDDLGVPVIVFQAENDAGGLQARQADSAIFRLYEVAGTAHFDMYGLVQAATDTGTRQTVAEWFESMRNPLQNPPGFVCNFPVNTGPATFVARASIAHLNRWITDGTPPPMAPRLDTISISPVQYATDANGNVLGGIRTPAVDAPLARLTGLGNGGQQFCNLFGVTEPFPETTLQQLYRNHGGFVSRWNRATDQAVATGFVLPEDGDHMKVVAAQSSVLK